MNMRAAEAIVSKAPKAMKTFPISEVWSQVELSLLAAATEGLVAGGGASAEASATGVAGGVATGVASCKARSTSLS